MSHTAWVFINGMWVCHAIHALCDWENLKLRARAGWISGIALVALLMIPEFLK